MNTELAGKPLIIWNQHVVWSENQPTPNCLKPTWPSEYPLWRTPKALETSASLISLSRNDKREDKDVYLSDNRGTSNSLRSGLESSQSKMELVVSIETPTTWFTEIRLRFRKGRTVIKMRMEHCLARKGLIGRVGGPEHRINIIMMHHEEQHQHQDQDQGEHQKH